MLKTLEELEEPYNKARRINKRINKMFEEQRDELFSLRNSIKSLTIEILEKEKKLKQAEETIGSKDNEIDQLVIQIENNLNENIFLQKTINENKIELNQQKETKDNQKKQIEKQYIQIRYYETAFDAMNMVYTNVYNKATQEFYPRSNDGNNGNNEDVQEINPEQA